MVIAVGICTCIGTGTLNPAHGGARPFRARLRAAVSVLRYSGKISRHCDRHLFREGWKPLAKECQSKQNSPSITAVKKSSHSDMANCKCDSSGRLLFRRSILSPLAETSRQFASAQKLLRVQFSDGSGGMSDIAIL